MILDPPRIVSASYPHTIYTVTEYSIKNLDVTIDSNPEYNATWYFSKDNWKPYNAITGKNLISNKSMSRLSFGEQGAEREDQGYYRVVASNIFGTTEKTTYLNVQCNLNSFRYFFCYDVHV